MENDKITTKYLWIDVIINVIVVLFFFFFLEKHVIVVLQHNIRNDFLSSFLAINDTLVCNIYVVLLKFIPSLALSLFPYMQYIMLN